MKKNSLENALTSAFLKGLVRSPDRYIRVELSSGYPLNESFVEVSHQREDLIIGLLSPHVISNFNQEALRIETNAAKLTKFRNERSTDAPSVILLGSAYGAEESGLRDLAIVISEKEVAKEWELVIQEILSTGEQNRDKLIRKELSIEILSRITSGDVNPKSASTLIEILIDESKTLSEFQKSLYLIDLMPDDQLVGSKNLKSRLKLNAMHMQKAESPDDVEFHARLNKSSIAEIRALKTWLKTKESKDLSASSLPALIKLLGEKEEPEGGTGTGIKGPNGISLLNILLSEEMEDEVVFKRDCVEAIRSELGDRFWLKDKISADVFVNDKKVNWRQESQYGEYLSLWLKAMGKISETDEVKYSEASSIPVFYYADNLEVDSLFYPFACNALENWATKHGLVDRVSHFLDSRHNLLTSVRLLSSSDEDVLVLMFLSKEIRDLVESYLRSWQHLLKDATERLSLDDVVLLQFIDAIWLRKLDRNETVDSATFIPKAKYEKVVLAPWHPWRLKPLLELSLEVSQDPWDSQVVSSALWALSRAVPLYRVWASTLDRDNLQFKTSISGHCEFAVVDTEAIQSMTGNPVSIERSLRAYFDSHSWAESGVSGLMVNPPSGGSAFKIAAELSRHTKDSNSSALTIIRKKNLAGQESSDNFDGLIAFHDADELETELDELNNFDVAMIFLPAMNASINSIQTGAHGKIDVSLKPKALTPEGNQIYEPQITVSPDSENEYINLLYRASGQESTHVATYPLVVQEDHRRLIEKVVRMSEWTIVAIPGAVGVPEVYLDDARIDKASVVAQFDDQQYRCFTYSRSLLPLVWKVRDYVNEHVPINTSADAQLVILEALSDLADSQHTKMFELSNNKFGVNEIFGLMAAREFAKKLVRPGSLVLEISLDDTDWTNSWLDRKEQRADLILVDVTLELASDAPVKLIVIEAKARSENFGLPEPDVDPFAGAIHQVGSTIDKLRHLMIGRKDSVSQSIRLRAFTEQIAAVASSEYMRATNQANFEDYFLNLSRFISDPNSALETIQGLVVTLFTSGQEDAISRSIAGTSDTTLVSCSAKALEEIFLNKEVSVSGYIEPEKHSAPSVPVPETKQNQASSIESNEKSATFKSSESSNVVSIGESEDAAAPLNAGLTDSTFAEEKKTRLIENLRLYSRDVDSSGETLVTEGPTFDAFSVPLNPGASLATLQRSSQDIARELGVTSIEISNDDSRKGCVLILVPRTDRQFPNPPDALPTAIEGTYLPIFVGQELSGINHVSAIQSWPHALVAGTTGSGKTSFLRGLIEQVSKDKRYPSQLIVVDGKGESDYFGIAPESAFHPNYPKPQTSMSATAEILNWLVEVEIPRRRLIINNLATTKNSRVEAKDEYLSAIKNGETPIFLPIVVVVDEFAELMLERGPNMQNFVDNVSSVCQTGRSTLIHLILATQRPDRKIVPGRIHANLDTKIALRVPTPADSMTVLGYGGAEKLLGSGDMFFSWKGAENQRLQGYHFR
jgi:hypothetical protein